MIAPSIERALWPIDRLGDALRQLAHASGMDARQSASQAQAPSPQARGRDRETLAIWIEAASRALGLEANELRVPFRDVAAAIASAAPALMLVGWADRQQVVSILRCRGRVVDLLRPDGRRERVSLRSVLDAVRGDLDAEAAARIDGLLDRAAITPSRRARAQRGLLDQVHAGRLVDIGWSLALQPSAPFSTQLREAGVFASARTIVLMQLLVQGLGAASWWLIGRAALQGQIERGWLFAWGLVLLSAIVPGVVGGWAQGTAALRFAILLKRRLLNGALRLDPEEVRHQGSGELLGRVIESSALESLVTTGGLTSLTAVVEAVVAAAVLSLPATGYVAAASFAVFVSVLLLLAAAVAKRMADWTRVRLHMTRDLIERMIGHRTRLVQEPREHWHVHEDELLTQYSERSASLDRVTAWMQGALPRAWLVVGIVAFAPGFARGAIGAADLAVAIGGILLGYRAVGQITLGIGSLLRARVAWDEVRPLFEAGSREETPGCPGWTAATDADTVLEVRDLSFRYRDRHEPVLRGVNLRIARRDRVLVEGPSGGGKSTLGAVLTGLRAPDAGLVLLGGLDRQTLGDAGWRRRVVSAPQFHENHLVSAPLAFNVLMGRRWPPRESDLAEAHEVCADLGLGPLIERMPSGLMQMVGETGWQLSHGERSRVYIARALMQNAQLIVLDESFAALDPETLKRALSCVLRRAPALVVIAHP